jgi:hypothetical protein
MGSTQDVPPGSAELLPSRSLGEITAIVNKEGQLKKGAYSDASLGLRPKINVNTARFNEALLLLLEGETWTGIVSSYQRAFSAIFYLSYLANESAPLSSRIFEKFAYELNALGNFVAQFSSTKLSGVSFNYDLQINPIGNSQPPEYAVAPLFVIAEMLALLIGLATDYKKGRRMPGKAVTDKFDRAVAGAFRRLDYLARFLAGNVQANKAREGTVPRVFKYAQIVISESDSTAAREEIGAQARAQMDSLRNSDPNYGAIMLDQFVRLDAGLSTVGPRGEQYAPSPMEEDEFIPVAQDYLPAAAAAAPAEPQMLPAATAAADANASEDAEVTPGPPVARPSSADPVIGAYTELIAINVRRATPNSDFVKNVIKSLTTPPATSPLQKARDLAAAAITNATTPLAREMAWTSAITNEVELMAAIWEAAPEDVKPIYIAAIRASIKAEEDLEPGAIREYLNLLDANHIKLDKARGVFVPSGLAADFITVLKQDKEIKAQNAEKFLASARHAVRNVPQNLRFDTETAGKLNTAMNKEIFPVAKLVKSSIIDAPIEYDSDDEFPAVVAAPEVPSHWRLAKPKPKPAYVSSPPFSATSSRSSSADNLAVPVSELRFEDDDGDDY